MSNFSRSQLSSALAGRGFELVFLEDIDKLSAQTLGEITKIIDADRLEGQPSAIRESLKEAVEGRSPIDQGFWNEFSLIHSFVVSQNEKMVAVAGLGERADGSLVIAWLHTKEDPVITNEVLDSIVDSSNGAPLEAFSFASALSLGLEGLPYAKRNVTHNRLLQKGFKGEDLWLYMRTALLPESAEEVGEVSKDDPMQSAIPSKGAWNITLNRNNRIIAESNFEIDSNGVGILWWIGVSEKYRGEGIGRKLLKQSLYHLSQEGAQEVILYVDHDDSKERNRIPAIKLYQKENFEVIDHLWSYQLKIP